MTLSPPFRDEARAELSRLAIATGGAAALITPAFDVALVEGDLTDEAAQLARMNARSAPGWVGEAATFSCDDASWLHIVRVTDGWILVLQSRSGRDDVSAREALRAARNTMAILLAYQRGA